MSREILDAGEQVSASRQPVALAAALLLLAFALGARLQRLHLTVTLQSSRAFWRLPPLIAVLCCTLAFIAALLRCLLEMSAARHPGLLSQALTALLSHWSPPCSSQTLNRAEIRPLGKGEQKARTDIHLQSFCLCSSWCGCCSPSAVCAAGGRAGLVPGLCLPRTHLAAGRCP